MTYRLNKTETDFCREFGHALAKAENGMIEVLSGAAKITAEEAGKVFDLYKKHKLFKFDRTNSRYVVKHGALLDAATIRNALATA